MPNPNPQSGFKANPQNINKNGRPKKGYSITEWFKEMLASKPEVRDAIGKSIMKKALEGDTAAQKLVWQYMDGMPQQKMDHTTLGEKLPTPLLTGVIDVQSNDGSSEDSKA